MKYIILSFDDSRDDFYTRAYPILKKYGIPCTLNVISSLVKRTIKCDFPSSCGNGMSCEQVLECQQSGLVEIACHGATHKNTKEDFIKNIEEIKEMGCTIDNIGAASQGSEITLQNRNNDGVWDLVRNGTLSYLRSGIKIRREGLLYSALSLVDRYIHSNYLFFYLNKRCIIDRPREPFFLSTAIVNYTTIKQVRFLVERFAGNKDTKSVDSALIIMLHSILEKDDPGYGKDKWYWDIEKFDKLCCYLKENRRIKMITTQEYVNKVFNII